MPLSEFDRQHISDILAGRKGTWFTAYLLRLIANADARTRHQIAQEFPDEVAMVEAAIQPSGGFMRDLTFLIRKADTSNRARLRAVFPDEVAAVEQAYRTDAEQ